MKRPAGFGKIVTADRVVDASAIAAVVFNEPRRPIAEAKLAGAVMHAPAFIDIEMASICLKKIRAKLYPRSVLLEMYETYDQVTIRKSSTNLREALELAERTDLSIYDADYLWLARHLGCELVTLDGTLEKVAARLKI